MGSMHIVCPHCTTSYAIDLATLGTAGRTVRCSRCKEVWLARPENAIEIAAPAPAMAATGEPAGHRDDSAAEWDALAREYDSQEQEAPVVDSPSIASDWPSRGEGSPQAAEIDWPSAARHDAHAEAPHPQRQWGAGPRAPGKPFVSLATVCAAMGALVLALVIWRADVVRLLPQTAAFYRMVGLNVNLRGLSFQGGKVTSKS